MRNWVAVTSHWTLSEKNKFAPALQSMDQEEDGKNTWEPPTLLIGTQGMGHNTNYTLMSLLEMMKPQQKGHCVPASAKNCNANEKVWLQQNPTALQLDRDWWSFTKNLQCKCLTAAESYSSSTGQRLMKPCWHNFHTGVKVGGVCPPRSINMCASCLSCSCVSGHGAQQEHHKQPNLWAAAEAVLQNKYLG
jgi:hypothetical protein